jgi:hypothetical protein
VLGKWKDHTIKYLYFNAHCGSSVTNGLIADEETEYRKIIKSKLYEKGAEIHIYSCFQGTTLEHRKKLQRLADETGAVVWAKTGKAKTPFGGGTGDWIKYTPGGEVPYKDQGYLGEDSPPKK